MITKSQYILLKAKLEKKEEGLIQKYLEMDEERYLDDDYQEVLEELAIVQACLMSLPRRTEEE